jgi:hypothetical protein
MLIKIDILLSRVKLNKMSMVTSPIGFGFGLGFPQGSKARHSFTNNMADDKNVIA